MATINSLTQLALINASNPGTINLPSASLGQLLTFKDCLGTFGTNNITLVCAGADTFEDGVTSKLLKEVRGNIQIVGSGTKWYVLSGTQVNTITVSSITSAAISTNSISSSSMYVSSLALLDNNTSTNILNTSTFLKYNNYIIAGTRVGYNNLVNPISYVTYSANYPKKISGLTLWFDAYDSSTVSFSSGSNVSQWKDKSGSGINMLYYIGTVVYNTIGFNNSPTITFGSGRSGLSYSNSTLNLSATASLSFYIVFKVTSSSGNGRVLSFYSDATSLDYANPGICLFFDASQKISFARGAPYTANNTTVIVNTNVFTSMMFNGNTTGTYAIPLSNTGISVNGGTFTNYTGYSIGTAFGSTYNPITIGAITYDATSIFNGNISEIIMYNRALNATENSQVEGYLAWKWGIVSSLPASHQYKTTPPL